VASIGVLEVGFEPTAIEPVAFQARGFSVLDALTIIVS
jgi:hypothetical protein